MMFVIPSSVQETKKTLLKKYDVDVSQISPEKCQAYFDEIGTLVTIERGKRESHKNYENVNGRVDEGRKEKVDKKETFLGGSKQHCITLICNNENNRRLKYGGLDIKPSFTGVNVEKVTVTDNKDGSYTISFCPVQVGILKFEVFINGVPAPNCSLTKQVKWVMSDVYGKGVVTDGGFTMKGEGRCYCCRIGWCSFESGSHMWKVQLRNLDKSDVSDKDFIPAECEVGIIDADEINADISQSEKKWVHKHSVQCGHSDVLSLTLDMERKRLNVMVDSNYCYSPNVRLQFTALRVVPFFACNSSNVSISIVE
jgi:hypothetical protein